MTEQELRDNKFRADVENALHQNRSLTMIAQTIWELTKAYADARESKSANKIAEIRRLCKAFLYDLPCSHNVSVIGEFLDAYANNKILDEFKKTVVAAKDKEIAELKAENKTLDNRCSRLANIANQHRSAATAHFIHNLALKGDVIPKLNAEIKRLRDGIAELRDWDYPNQMHIEKCNALLSPAPVTEGPKKTFSLQMYECNRCEWYGQVGESIETESYDVCPKCLSEDLTLLDSPKNEDQE